jgi:A/G-specific adenine glycosylase
VQQAVPVRAGDFAQALMDLGATICAPRNATCMLCPLQAGCAGTTQNPLRFPVKAEKAERPTRYGHAFVIFDAAGDIYLEKRVSTGLLGGMTQMPVSDWGAERLPLQPPLAADWRGHGQIVHVFTHFRLELEVWSARAADPAALDQGWWASPGELGAEALPSVFRKALAAAGVE